MLWFWFALVPALTVAIRDVSVKRFKDLGPLQVAGIELFWSLPPLAVGLLFTTVPPLDSTFWWAFVFSFPFNIAAYLLYLYAIKFSPVSLSVPFLAFTPAFMLLTGILVLGEKVNLYGGLGVALIVLGSFILHLQSGQGLFNPFRSFVREKGSWIMLIVAILFSFAAVIGKKGMQHSSPLFFSLFFFLCFNLILVATLLSLKKCSVSNIIGEWRRGAFLAGLLIAHIVFHSFSIVLVKAVYMVAVKRSSIVFTVFLSWYLLGEGNRWYRGSGTLSMFAGVLLITILG